MAPPTAAAAAAPPAPTADAPPLTGVQRAVRALTDPDHAGPVMLLILLGELVLNIAMVLRVPCMAPTTRRRASGKRRGRLTASPPGVLRSPRHGD